MDNFIPDIYMQSIYTINYKKLKKRGIKCLLFDLNNTLVSYDIDYPDDKLRELIFELEKNFKVIIVSNSSKNRIRPFKEKLNIDAAYSARKPFKYKFKKIINMYNFQDTEVAMIGDELLTDVYGGNKMGFTTILVNAISENEPFHTRVERYLESKIIKRLNKQDILIKGNYYE